MGFRLADLNLTLAHSNGQGQFAVGMVCRKIFWPSCFSCDLWYSLESNFDVHLFTRFSKE